MLINKGLDERKVFMVKQNSLVPFASIVFHNSFGLRLNEDLDDIKLVIFKEHRNLDLVSSESRMHFKANPLLNN